MCVVSMVGDHFHDKWKDLPWIQPNQPYVPKPQDPNTINKDWLKDYIEHNRPNVTREEHEKLMRQFEDLKKEVEEMKALLIRAIEYDKRNNEPNCEMEEKVAVLKRMAELFGVDLSMVFNK